MTLTEHLKQRLQDVADAARQAGRENDFTDKYSELLSELTAAMRLMQRLAMVQGEWLFEETSRQARDN